jgi:hypothetical protein
MLWIHKLAQTKSVGGLADVLADVTYSIVQVQLFNFKYVKLH